MKLAEMNARLAELTTAEIERIKKFIKEGYGATGIRFETGHSIRLINAVFEQHRLDCMAEYHAKHAA